MTRRNSLLYYISAFFTGSVISVMVTFNTKLSELTSNSISLLFNQITGVLLLSFIMLVGIKNPVINPPRKKSKWWMWFGGLFGLVIISINYITVTNSNTTLSMAGAVLGQVITGVIFDLTGWFGMEKRVISRRRIISLMVSFIGIFVLLLYPSSSFSPIFFLYLFLAMISGSLTMIQMVYNSSFAKLKGTFFSARQNVISGLGGILLFILIFNFKESVNWIKSIPSIPFYFVIMGGLLGTIVVLSTNIIIPKIPGAISSILISSGQILTALVVDLILSFSTGNIETISLGLPLGAIIMILGLCIGG